MESDGSDPGQQSYPTPEGRLHKDKGSSETPVSETGGGVDRLHEAVKILKKALLTSPHHRGPPAEAAPVVGLGLAQRQATVKSGGPPSPAESLRRVLNGDAFRPKWPPWWGASSRHGPPLVSRLPAAGAADEPAAPGLPPLPALAALVDGPDWGRVAELPAFRAALGEALAGDGRHPLVCARRVASVALSGLLGPPAQARAALRPAWERVGEGLQAAMLLAPAALQKAYHQECARLTVLDPRLKLHCLNKEDLNRLAWAMGLQAGRTRSREELLVALFDEDAARRAAATPPGPLPPQLLLAYAMLRRWRVTAWEGNAKQGLQLSILRGLPSTTYRGVVPSRGDKPRHWAHHPDRREGLDASLYRLRDVLAARGTHWMMPPKLAREEDVKARESTREAMQGTVLRPLCAPLGEGPQSGEVSRAVEEARAAAAAAAGPSEKQPRAAGRQQQQRPRQQEAARAMAREEAAAALRFGDGPHLRATLERLEERRREALGGDESACCAECPFCRHSAEVEGVLAHLMEAPCWAAVQCFPR